MIPKFSAQKCFVEGRGEDGRDNDGEFSITLSRRNPTASLRLVRVTFQSPLLITGGGRLEDDAVRTRTWVSSTSRPRVRLRLVLLFIVTDIIPPA